MTPWQTKEAGEALRERSAAAVLLQTQLYCIARSGEPLPTFEELTKPASPKSPALLAAKMRFFLEKHRKSDG